MTKRNERNTIVRILRVNHAGECGAVRIYKSQIGVARFLFPDLLPFLRETIAHERRHREVFSALLRERHARPCALLPLWGVGGSILGILTALMGRNGIWICTAAVEQAVHRHLGDQIEYLEGRDPAVLRAVSDIQAEELTHLIQARQHGQMSAWPGRFLLGTVVALTEALIWVSTYGASGRLKSINDE